MMDPDTTAGALAGIRVIDCASYIAAPAAATLLSDFGAEVIKIEPPEGDPYRRLVPGLSYPWDLDARNKRSLALDLKHPKAASILARLVKGSDVFITNLPAAVRARLRIDSGSLRALNPRLIYASMSAHGERGPEAHAPGFDTTAYWARSGLSDLVKEDEDSAPSRSVTGMGDHPSAMSLYAAIMTALYLRERTGEGTVVRSSLLANGLWANAALVQASLNGTPPAPRQARARAPNPLANIYRCSDERWINLTLLNERQFAALCTALQCPELAEDARFASHEGRALHHEAMVSVLDQCMARHPSSHWLARLREAGIPAAPIARLSDLADDPQLHAIDALVPFADNGLTVNSPIELDNAPKRAPQRAARVPGEHSREVLATFGYDSGEIDALCAQGAVVQS
jgi:crotonobetainyl-CoA:carnitine CoA-transferase CaiB-like acyl-CoA transferase